MNFGHSPLLTETTRDRVNLVSPILLSLLSRIDPSSPSIKGEFNNSDKLLIGIFGEPSESKLIAVRING